MTSRNYDASSPRKLRKLPIGSFSDFAPKDSHELNRGAPWHRFSKILRTRSDATATDAPLADVDMLALTLAALALREGNLKGEYTTVVDKHISEIMPLFLSDDLNFEWADRLMHQEQIWTREHGYLAYQQHSMPWPLSPRDLLLTCWTNEDHRDAVFTSECRSVAHPSQPSPTGFVRMELAHTLWRLAALPGGKTRLHLEMEVPAHVTVGVPKYVVKHVQTKSLKDSVTALIAAVDRLSLPPHEGYARWKRTRSEVATARVLTKARVSPPSSSLVSLLRLLQRSSHLTLALALLLVLHCVAFGVLGQYWRRTPGKARSEDHSKPLETCTSTDDTGPTGGGVTPDDCRCEGLSIRANTHSKSE